MEGLNQQEFLDILRIDLKDSGALWTDAELVRSLKRATQDLSRHFPRQEKYETSIEFDVSSESVVMPATASSTYIVNGVSLSGESAGATLSIASLKPDVPRRLTMTLTDANNSITELSICVKGYDRHGYYIEERWTLPELHGGSAVQGHKYFSRVYQVELEYISGSAGVGDLISVGTGNAYDSFVYLANAPLKKDQETVTDSGGTTEYTRNTDYVIDHANGGIKFVNGGSISAGDTLLVTYIKSKIGVNISSVLPFAKNITKVEYPANRVPQEFCNYEIYGNFMTIVGKGKTQEEMTDSLDNHLCIWYDMEHSPPGPSNPGSWPAVYDQLVAIGAGGYALLIEAQQYEQQAATDLTAMRTELGLTTDVHVLAAAAFDKINTYLANNTNEDAKYWLTKITTDAANLRTAIETAVDAVVTNLGLVFTNSLDKATTGAEAYLDAGDDNVTAVTDAPELERYIKLVESRVAIAVARIQAASQYNTEAVSRLDNLRTYIEQAAGWSGIAEGFLNEGMGRLREIEQHLMEARQFAEAANGDIILADRFRTEGLARLNEFEMKLRDRANYRRQTSSIPRTQPK